MVAMSDFEWRAKDRLNQTKHGVGFGVAQLAFLDPGCVIAEDTDHSRDEQSFFCFGRVAEGIVTVRFTRRGEKIRIDL